jgi:hypothetical protein
MTLAGGIASVAGCGGLPSLGGIPCGNASPDPCICDRPATDPASKVQCDVKKACEAEGRTYTTIYVDGTIQPHCEDPDAGADNPPKADASDDGAID